MYEKRSLRTKIFDQALQAEEVKSLWQHCHQHDLHYTSAWLSVQYPTLLQKENSWKDRAAVSSN